MDILNSFLIFTKLRILFENKKKKIGVRGTLKSRNRKCFPSLGYFWTLKWLKTVFYFFETYRTRWDFLGVELRCFQLLCNSFKVTNHCRVRLYLS